MSRFALVPLLVPVRVSEDVLAAVCDLSMWGRDWLVHTPRLWWTDDGRAVLGQPDVADGSPDPQKYDYWGSATQRERGSRTVTGAKIAAVVLQPKEDLPGDADPVDRPRAAHEYRGVRDHAVVFESQHPQGEQVPRVASSIVQGVDEWLDGVRVWAGVLARQNTSTEPRPAVLGTAPGVVWCSNDDGHSWSASHLGTVAFEAVVGDFGDTDLDLANFADVLLYAANGVAPPAAYRFLSDAVNQLHRGAWSRVVIDAATAVELACDELLRSELASLAPSLSQSLSDRMTLGVLVRHLRYLGLPANLGPGVVEVRNALVHRGVAPSASQARTALDLADSIVRQVISLHAT